MEALDREEAARQIWLESPEAVRAREESRGAFAGLGAAEAQQLLSDLFGEQLAELNADPARYLSDVESVKAVDDTVATVKDEGEGVLLDAGIPVRAEDDAGRLRPVDLSLVASEAGYAPVNSLAETYLPGSADEEIQVGGDGLRISQAGADDRAARRFGDKNLFYDEVLPDTDLFIAPTATGVEIFNLLRSQNSPETLRFEQDLPTGAELRSDGNGGAEIARGEDVLVHVPFPTAVDAQGTLVPVELQIDGSSIVLQIPHRSEDLAYPILVDPDYSEDNWYNCSWYNGCNFQGLSESIWRFVKSPENGNWIYGSTSCIDQWACWPPGGRSLFVTSTNGNFGANYYGEYIYDAPGTTGYISGYRISPFWRQNHTNCTQQTHPYPRDYNGLYGSSWTVFEANRADDYGDAARYDLTDTSARKLVIGLGAGPGASIPCWRSIMAGGVQTWLKDPENPTAYKVLDPPTSWVSTTTPITVKTQAYDPGLGIRNVNIGTTGNGVIPHTPVQNDCPGNRENPCPNELLATFNLTGSSFGEGRRAASVTAYDATSKYSNPYYFETKVDGTEPEVKLDGQLAEATEEDEGPAQGDEEIEKLRLPVYNLKIEAEDGTAGSNEKLWRSGVKSIEVVFDGNLMKSWTQACPANNCPMTQTYQLKLSNLPSGGKHKLEVKTIDHAGNLRLRDIEFEYFPATGMKDEYVMHYFPLPDGQGDESAEEHPDRPELAVNVMNGNLVYREQDVEVDGPGVDLEVERYYNSQLPDEDNTEWGDGWTLAQTPDLEPIDTGGSPAPEEAEILDASGAIEDEVELPVEAGAQEFNPELQATLTKKPAGGYELSDETGESATAVAFSESGRTEALVTDGYAKVDYTYEGGELAEIAVDDPGTFSVDPASIEEVDSGPISEPIYTTSFGAEGTGDGQLKAPGDAAVDSAGNLWVVDKANNRVQKFDATGKYLAKFGTSGSGNGQFNRPTAIAIAANGDLLVADSANNRVQRFNSSGTYLSKFGSKGTGNGQFGGSGPEGIAIDGEGNIWVADTYGGRLLVFSSSGAFLETVGSKGTGSGQLDEPSGIDIDLDGNVWVAEWGNNRVSVFDSSDGTFLSKFGSPGSGDGQFNRPDTLTVDALGNVWVGDQDNDRIQRFDLAGQYQGQFGSGGSGDGEFNLSYPMGIAADSKGHLWITDVDNHRVQAWMAPIPEPAYARSFGSEGTGDGQLKAPADVAVDTLGNLWVVDKSNNRVQKFDASGKYVAKFSYGALNAQLNRPTAIAIAANGDLLVADSGANRVQRFSSAGAYLSNFGSKGTGNGQFGGSGPEGIAVDPAGNILVADTYGGRVQKFDDQGQFIETIGSQGTGDGELDEPSGIDVDLDGNLWVAEWGNNRLSVFDSDGTFLSHVGSAGSGDGEFNHPDTVTVDARANVWVGDQDNNRIQRFDIAGQYLGQFGAQGSGAGQFELSYPMGIASDSKGHLWVTDVDNHRVQEWLFGNFAPPVEPQPIDDDPVVEVETESDLVSSLEGEEAGEHTYEHEGELLTAHDGPLGESTYEYDSAGRMTKVTLPNGTWGQIAYYESDGRVKSVTVDPAGSAPAKTTGFDYSDEPRRTFVEVPGAPNVTYDIGDDGSVLKWWNAKSPPTIQPLSGTLYDNKETPEPISVGDYSLLIHGYSEEGVESIQIVANGNQLVDEKTCPQIPGNGATECVDVENAWVLETDSHSPGILNLEVIVTDTDEGVAAERFWVNVPRTPPPLPGADVPPRFKDIKKFREDYGLEVVFPVASELALNERIFNLIAAWHNPNSPTGQVARASWERWGVPLRPADVAELEYREWFYDVNAERIEQWVEATSPSSYAGYYIDHAAGGVMHIGFTQNQESQLGSLKTSLLLVAGERLQIYPTTPTASYLSVRATSQSVSSVIESNSNLRELVVSVEEDEAGKAVRVGTPNVAQVESTLNQMLGPNAPIAVQYDAGGGGPLSGRFRNQGRMRAGDFIASRAYYKGVHVGSVGCTAGFGAKNKIGMVRGQAIWSVFVLTAGHCTQFWHQPVYRSTDSEPANEDNWEEVGLVTRDAFEYFDSVRTDAEAIEVNDSGIVPQGIFGAGGE